MNEERSSRILAAYDARQRANANSGIGMEQLCELAARDASVAGDEVTGEEVRREVWYACGGRLIP